MGRCYRRRKKLKKTNILNNNLKFFYKWIISNGCKFKGTKISNFLETGHGLLAKKRFDIGDSIIEIPFNLLISKSLIKKSYLAPLLDSMNFNECDVLTLFLFCEKLNHNSYIFDYLSTLPIEINLPIYWSDEDIKKINSSFYDKVQLQKRKICSLWIQFITQISNLEAKHQTYDPFLHKILKLTIKLELSKKCHQNYFSSVKSIGCLNVDKVIIKNKEDKCNDIFSLEDEDLWNLFIWSWCMVNSRSICLNRKSRDEIDNCVLAPFLDLLNHSHSVKTEVFFNEEKQVFILKTLNKIKKNTQIFINYGPHDNLNLLLDYGFIIPNIPHDVFAWNLDDILRLFDYSSQSNFFLKVKYIQEKNLNKFLFCNTDELSWNLIKTLQILICPFEQLNVNSTYREYKGNEETNQLIHQISIHLINDSLSNMKTSINFENNSRNIQLINGLLQIYRNILTNCLHNLNNKCCDT